AGARLLGGAGAAGRDAPEAQLLRPRPAPPAAAARPVGLLCPRRAGPPQPPPQLLALSHPRRPRTRCRLHHQRDGAVAPTARLPGCAAAVRSPPVARLSARGPLAEYTAGRRTLPRPAGGAAAVRRGGGRRPVPPGGVERAA